MALSLSRLLNKWDFKYLNVFFGKSKLKKMPKFKIYFQVHV